MLKMGRHARCGNIELGEERKAVSRFGRVELIKKVSWCLSPLSILGVPNTRISSPAFGSLTQDRDH